MTFLVSAKGNDITAWRAARDFATTYRQVLLEQVASGNFGTAEELFSKASSTLEKLTEEHETLTNRLDGLLNEISVATQPSRLKELINLFYTELYRHMELFQAAPAFYQMSMACLNRVSSTLITYAMDQLGLFAERMPKIALLALGPAGRSEFTPFCPLQLMLVHGDTDASGIETLNLFSHILHSGFEETGLRIDPVVTPRNPVWRGNLAQWKQRCLDGLQKLDDTAVINLLRLADPYVLTSNEELGQKLKEISIPLLQASRPALSNLVSRMISLSNGLSLMGGLKLERRKPDAGLFCLLDHGLLPLSSAISVLTLIKKATAGGSTQRVRELLFSNQLDVDLTERILATWHTLHEFLLLREKNFSIGTFNNQSTYINPEELDETQLNALKGALESVGFIQRQVGSIFSWIGE